MKTIKSLKDITTLEVGDKVIFGNLEYIVRQIPESKYHYLYSYYLYTRNVPNDQIFKKLHIHVPSFIKKLGIIGDYDQTYVSANAFPEFRSLEALTAIVSALFKEYEKQNEFPKTWEEFCEKNRVEDEYFTSNCSGIVHAGGSRSPISDKNLCTSRQEAEAHLALMQLRQLRKAYVKDWEPNWTCDSTKFCIIVDVDKMRVTDHYFCQRSLSFPTQKLANQFLTNFKDLLKIAKPLL